MTTTTTPNFDSKAILEIETTGSLLEAGTGIAVIVLAIIGLAHADSAFFGSIAAIVLGVSLMAQGGAIAAEYSKLLSMITGGTLGEVELGGGMTVELLAGAAIVVLGILGLIGIFPDTLIASGVIAVGAALILGAAGLERLNTLKVQAAGYGETAARATALAVVGAITSQVLCGGSAIVLGILALCMPVHASVLVMVGILVLGAAVAFSGSALTGRLLKYFNFRRHA